MYQQDYSSEAETDQAKPMWIAIMEIQWMLAKNDILKKAILLWTLSESFDRLLLENLRARTKFNEIVDIFLLKLSKGTFKNMLTRTSPWYLVANPDLELSGRGQSLLALPAFLPSAIFLTNLRGSIPQVSTTRSVTGIYWFVEAFSFYVLVNIPCDIEVRLEPACRQLSLMWHLFDFLQKS